jgi:hypothetical protein
MKVHYALGNVCLLGHLMVLVKHEAQTQMVPLWRTGSVMSRFIMRVIIALPIILAIYQPLLETHKVK